MGLLLDSDGSDAAPPAFARLPEMDLDRMITVTQHGNPADLPPRSVEEAAAERLEAQHNTPFDLDSQPAPLWRLAVLDDRAGSGRVSICFCFHHAIMDTKSALVFHEDLLNSLLRLEPNEPSPALIRGSVEPLLPPLEALNPLPVSEEYIQRCLASRKPGDEVWSGNPQVVPVKTRISFFWLSSADSQTLRRRCKEHGSSPTALIMAAMASAMFAKLPERYTTLVGDCAVSVRHLMPAPITARSMGCYVGTFTETYSRPVASETASESLRADSQRTKATIVAALASRCAECPIGLLNRIADVGGFFSAKLGQKRWGAFELSNVGTLEDTTPAPDESRYDLESLLFSQSAGATSPVLKISVASGKDGRLGFSFSWQQGVVEDDLIIEVIAAFKRTLLDI